MKSRSWSYKQNRDGEQRGTTVPSNLYVHVTGIAAEGDVLSSGRRGKNSREAQVRRKKRGQEEASAAPGKFKGNSGAEDQPGWGSSLCPGAASSMKEHSRRGEASNSRPREEQRDSRPLAQGL